MKLYYREATTNLLKTYPFVLLRMGLALFFTVGVLLLALLALWVGITFGHLPGIGLAVLLGLILLVVLLFVQPYLLYLVEGAHVAVLTTVIEDGKTPERQFAYGKDTVRANFASVSVLFVIDRAIKRLLKQLNSLIDAAIGTVTSNVPGSSSSKQKNLIRGIGAIIKLTLNIAIGYIDKAIMANLFRREADNNWQPAKEGVVLYAKTWKPILIGAGIVATIFYAPFILAAVFHEEILAALGGQAAVEAQLESFLLGMSDAALIVLVLTVIALLAIIHFGIIKPWLTALVLTIFLNETRDKEPDSEWEAKLRQHSDEFQEFERRAADDSAVDEKTGTWRDYFLP